MTAKPAGSPLYHTCQRIEPSPFLRPRLPEPANCRHLLLSGKRNSLYRQPLCCDSHFCEARSGNSRLERQIKESVPTHALHARNGSERGDRAFLARMGTLVHSFPPANPQVFLPLTHRLFSRLPFRYRPNGRPEHIGKSRYRRPTLFPLPGFSTGTAAAAGDTSPEAGQRRAASQYLPDT